jgi:hypothetical protein
VRKNDSGHSGGGGGGGGAMDWPILAVLMLVAFRRGVRFKGMAPS